MINLTGRVSTLTKKQHYKLSLTRKPIVYQAQEWQAWVQLQQEQGWQQDLALLAVVSRSHFHCAQLQLEIQQEKQVLRRCCLKQPPPIPMKHFTHEWMNEHYERRTSQLNEWTLWTKDFTIEWMNAMNEGCDKNLALDSGVATEAASVATEAAPVPLPTETVLTGS